MFGGTGTLPAKDKLPLGQMTNRSATSQMGIVLPNSYGRQRIGCTFISNFFDIKSQTVSSGGKGTSAGTNYYASFAVAVGHGPFNKFCNLYLNGDPVFLNTNKLYAASLTQANNIATYQTKNPHNLTTGDSVVIYYAFQPEFNGEFVITVISPTQFQYTIPGSALAAETATRQNGQKIYALAQLDPISRNSINYTYGPTLDEDFLAGLNQSGGVATFNTTNNHNLNPGDQVLVAGSATGGYNGIQTVLSTPTAKQFTFTVDSGIASPAFGFATAQKITSQTVVGADVTTVTIPDFGTADIHWGTLTQPRNAYLSDVSGIEHPLYKGICYIVFHQLFLGFNQTNAQNVEVVMERQPQFAWQSNPGHEIVNPDYGDCNPASIIADYLLNPRNGLALSAIDDVNTASLDAAIEQFYSENVGLAPVTTRADELSSQFLAVLENVDAAPALDDCGRIAIAMQREPVDPPTVTQADLSDLPNFTPNDWSSVTNETYLTFIDQDAGWVQDYVLWKDDAGIYGKERAEPQTLDRPLVTHRDLAIRLAALFGAIGALPKCDGKLKLIWDDDLFDSLAPGNAFQFTNDLRPTQNAMYRVTSRSIPDPAKPVFEIEVSIDRSYLYSTPETNLIGSAIKGGGIPTPPGNIKDPIEITDPIIPPLAPIPDEPPSTIVELPVALCLNSQPAIAALVTRGTQADTMAALFLGRNFAFNGDAPDSFFALAAINGFAFAGELMADFLASKAYMSVANALPAEASPNPLPLVCGMTIQLSGIDLILPDVCDFDALANSVLIFVGNEIMAISEATMTDSGAYSLTVIRGRFGTPIEDHHANDDVWIIRLADLQPIQHAHFLGGNTAAFKLTIGDQNVSDVDEFDVTFAGTRWNFPIYLQQPPAGM